MTKRIFFLIVLRVHLIVIAVRSGGLFEIDDRSLPTAPAIWVAEASPTTAPASESS